MLLSTRLLFSCLIVWMLQSTCQAQSPSLLWKISGNGLQHPSYLFGTIHIICAKDFAITSKVSNALAASDQLILEINLSDSSELEQMKKLISSSIPISKLTSPEQQVRIDSLLRQHLQLTLQQADHLSLLAIHSMLFIKMIGCNDIKTYELELIELAKTQNKKIGALETVSEQGRYTDSVFTWPDLIRQMEKPYEFSENLAGMIKVYKNEQLDSIAAYTKDERFMSKKAEYWLLTSRNERWADQIPELIKDKPTLFAVGAGHLPGEYGVIELLKKKGYIVEPVFN